MGHEMFFIHAFSLLGQFGTPSPTLLIILSFFPALSALSQTKPLPTGLRLDPAGENIKVGNMPLAMTFAPTGEKLIVSLGGWREQGIQVVDVQTRHVDQTLKQDGAFLGLAFSRDLSAPDKINDAAFNRVLWKMLKGNERPMPLSASASAVHLLRIGR